nr:type II toxin-antitoxin system RelB/DinJ family antitoxin [uncultured Sellimonas sp.]
MAKTFLQVRTEERDKEQASVILEELGTNLSSVVNMLLKQIIMTKSIPFEVKMPQAYTEQEKMAEVQASMEMEHLTLTEEDLKLLGQYRKAADKDKFREKILAEYTEA